MAASGSLSIATEYTVTSATNTGGTASDVFPRKSFNPRWASGTGDDQFDLGWSHVNLTLTTSETFTLSALTGPLGSVAFVEVVEVVIWNDDDTASLIVGNAATNPWAAPFGSGTHTVTIPPGGCLVLVAPRGGYAVAAGSSDQLKIAASAGSIPYSVQCKGRSA